MNFSQLIEDYILSHKRSWAKTTLRNEESRLNAHVVHINSDPGEVYERLAKRMKPYSIKTTFIRLSDFYQWLIDNDKIPPTKNPWKAFMDSHANLFKYAYQPERIEITYDEAKKRIETISDREVRTAALQMLEGGLRSCELKTFDGRRVVGKGGKIRDVYLSDEAAYFRWFGTYYEVYSALKAIGLKPHTLRKLFATEFSSQPGVSLTDTMEVCGWNSMETASKYIQPMHKEKLAALVKKATGK